MTSLREKIKEKRNIKDTSLNTYICAIKTIKKKLNLKDDDKSLENIDFLDDFDKVFSVINLEKTITSKKNKITAILVALSTDKEKNAKLIEKYNNELKKMNDSYLSFLKQQKKTDTQEKNWITYPTLISIINSIAVEVTAAKINKLAKEALSNRDFDLLQQYIILRTYLSFPIRNDYANMKVINIKEYNKLDAPENNFLVLSSNNKKQFYINEYKNRKRLGAKKFDIPTTLNKIINLWLRYNKSGYYLVKTNRTSPMNGNDITKYLNKIFRKYADGKKISTSMLRHIIISHSMKDEPTIKEKEEEEKKVEEKYLHSNAVNELYRKV